jgi:lysophospholipase L1-like esterase
VREAIVRLGLVCGGVLIALALLEAGLRLAAVVAPAVFARTSAPRDGRMRVACVGDSHVYGAFVPAGAAFPEQLDRVFRRRGIAADVYNFGIPGQNSYQVRERLPRILEHVRPQVVIVLVGHNNYWNLSDRRADAPDAGTAYAWSWRDLRLVRLLHVLRVSVREGAAAARRPELRLVEDNERGQRVMLDLGDGLERLDMWRGAGELTPAEVERVTDEDLRAIVTTIRAAGAVPVLLGYPVVIRPERVAVLHALERVTGAMDLLCLDTMWVTSRLQARHVPDLFFPDLHPTAHWYRPMAWMLARQLVRRGLVPSGRPRPPARHEPRCVPLV